MSKKPIESAEDKKIKKLIEERETKIKAFKKLLKSIESNPKK